MNSRLPERSGRAGRQSPAGTSPGRRPQTAAPVSWAQRAPCLFLVCRSFARAQSGRPNSARRLLLARLRCASRKWCEWWAKAPSTLSRHRKPKNDFQRFLIAFNRSRYDFWPIFNRSGEDVASKCDRFLVKFPLEHSVNV